MHSYLQNAPINLRLNFSFEKLLKRENLLARFRYGLLKGGENSSECRESWSARFSIKWASKSKIKFQFQEIAEK